jgi:mitochondrial enoyl-[acyl-carrier protein] reductase / trans-2-enoyl-CoA reductase
LRTHEFRRVISDLPKPKLAFDGVGGISSTEMARVLCPGGTLVVYGNSSRQHLQLPSSAFFMNNINVKGFSLEEWVELHSKEERARMVGELCDLVEAKKLRFWLETHRMSDWESALQKALEMQKNRKVVMMIEK